MKMKRLVSAATSLAMLFLLAACAPKEPLPPETPTQSGAQASPSADKLSFTPGTYPGAAQGHNGTIEVEIECSEDAITAINLISNVETPHLSALVFSDLPAQMIKEQSLAVDSIAGATVSSAGLKAAVSAAVTKAGGDVKLLNKAPPKQENTQSVNLEADVVVVGAGGAGMAIALAAEENGLSVILLEKNAMVGGHTALSGGWTLITGSKLQETYGVTDDTPEKAYADNWKNGGGTSVPELLELFCAQMGAAADWTVDYVQAAVPEKISKLAENGVDRAIIYKGAGQGISDALEAKLRQTTVQLYLDTNATALLTDADGVVGVEAKAKDGTTYTVTAKSTVLATGGYGARKDLLPEELKEFPYYGAALSTGDGLVMAQEVGADTVNMGLVEMFANGVEWAPGYAKNTGNGSNAVFKQGAILVDATGQRVVNERGPILNIVAAQKERDGMLFLLMDQKNYDLFREKVGGTGISLEMLDNWLAANGQSTPIHASGDTLEALAATMKMDSDALTKTVEKYNSYVETGVDEEFGRDASYMPVKIGDGPYYILEQKARYATTLGGLRVNTGLQVLKSDGEAISGLYAIGDTAGGVRGDDSISGADVGWAISSGYYLGQILAGK